MKTIEWVGHTVGTRYGLMVKGRVIDLPINAADSYIEQKLAVEYKASKSTKTKEENS